MKARGRPTYQAFTLLLHPIHFSLHPSTKLSLPSWPSWPPTRQTNKLPGDCRDTTNNGVRQVASQTPPSIHSPFPPRRFLLGRGSRLLCRIRGQHPSTLRQAILYPALPPPTDNTHTHTHAYTADRARRDNGLLVNARQVDIVGRSTSRALL